MIKLCVAFSESQGQCMHSHVCGSHRAKFDDDDFNRIRGTACEGQTDRHTVTHTHTHAHARTHTHTHTVYIKFVKVPYSYMKKKKSKRI